MKQVGRGRIVAAAALLVALAAGSLAASQLGANGGRNPTKPTPAAVAVEYARPGPGALDGAYVHAVGPVTRGAATGPAGCALGRPDERAWSRPAEPRRVAGRFACRRERGRAVMWWTVSDRGLLGHAVAANSDVAALFAWWLSHSER